MTLTSITNYKVSQKYLFVLLTRFCRFRARISYFCLKIHESNSKAETKAKTDHCNNNNNKKWWKMCCYEKKIIIYPNIKRHHLAFN